MRWCLVICVVLALAWPGTARSNFWVSSGSGHQRHLLSHQPTPVAQPQPAAAPANATTPTTPTNITDAASNVTGIASNATDTNSTSPAAAEASPAPASNSTKITEVLKKKIKDEIAEVETPRSKAQIAVAATFGSLILGSMVGCAGYLLLKRHRAKQRAAAQRRDGAAYAHADRIFGGGDEI